jgi:hypothetical protein
MDQVQRTTASTRLRFAPPKLAPFGRQLRVLAKRSAKLLRTFAERGGGQARQLHYVASQLRTTGGYPQCTVQTFGLDQATADTRRPVVRKHG